MTSHPNTLRTPHAANSTTGSEAATERNPG